MVTLAHILQELGYNDDWITFGIVDEAYLREQYAEYLVSEDKNQEHYRAVTFWSFMSQVETISDETIAHIFQLADNGPDNCDLSDDRIVTLVEHGPLTDKQYTDLAIQHPRVLTPPIQRRYIRGTLRRKIKASGIANNFEEIKARGDGQIQLEMLEAPDIARTHLEWLRDFGSNKAIRNRAREFLRSRRFARS
ncbi:MAG TPA: hypothetical protein VHO25_02020 [Polyangiaceae bacterium]|nr:hypothetical protein [Polyangiaceae bacterium]